MGYRYTMDASVSIHMLLDQQQSMASQYDAACFGAVTNGTIVTLDGVPGVVEYTAPGIATYTPVVQYAAAAATAAVPAPPSGCTTINNGATSNSINGPTAQQIAVQAATVQAAPAPHPTAAPPPPPHPPQATAAIPPQQTAYLAAVTDPNSSGYFEPGIHYVLPATTCDSSPVHQGDSYIVATPVSSTVSTAAESYDPKTMQQGKLLPNSRQPVKILLRRSVLLV